MNARWMESRYKGRCNCGAGFRARAVIQYDGARPLGSRITGCPSCRPEQSKMGPSDTYCGAGELKSKGGDPIDLAYEDQCAAACGLGGGHE